MDKKLKDKWIKALLDENTKQGHGALLYSNGEMCCIGVLGKVIGINERDLYQSRHAIGGYSLKPLDECGLSLDAREALADLNDFGVPFEVIAGLIAEAG